MMLQEDNDHRTNGETNYLYDEREAEKTLSKIIEDGNKEGKNAYESLKQAGYIKDATEFLKGE